MRFDGEYILTPADDPTLPITNGYNVGFDTPYCLKLIKDGRFHFLLKAKEFRNIDSLDIDGKTFKILSVTPVAVCQNSTFVLQSDMDVNHFSFLKHSASRYRLRLDHKTQTQYVLSGSVIDRTDFSGETIDWILP